jgi:hypothetical protein
MVERSPILSAKNDNRTKLLEKRIPAHTARLAAN